MNIAIVIWLRIGATHDSIVRAIHQIPWQSMPTVLGLIVTGWLVRAFRWHYFTQKLRWNVSLKHSMMAFFASSAMTATPGKAGELIKTTLLQSRYKVKLEEGAGILMVERLGDLSAVSLLALGGITLMAEGLPYFITVACLLLTVTVCLSVQPIYTAILVQFSRVHILEKIMRKLLCLLDTSHVLLHFRPLCIGLIAAFIAWSCEGLALKLLLNSFAIQVPILVALSIFGVSTLAGALSALPGGIGSFEFIMVLMLKHLSITTKVALIPVILFRFFTIWIASFVGLILLGSWPLTVGKIRC